MKYDTNDWHDVADVWYKLHNDLDYCVVICALILMWGANYINIRDNYYDYSLEEIKKVIARYNEAALMILSMVQEIMNCTRFLNNIIN